jgi:hypothetical protein
MTTTARPADYNPPAGGGETTAGAATQDELQMLFAPEDTELTPAQIEKILAAQVKLPSKARIGILPLEPGLGARFDQPDYTYLEGGISAEVTGAVRKSKRVYDASIMTKLVAPSDNSLMALRSAAARFQVDMILIYRPSFEVTQARKMLLKDRAHGLCTVESALIDTRTGLVLFTGVSIQEFAAEKRAHELKFEESLFKAKLEAVKTALIELAEGLVTYLNAVPG